MILKTRYWLLALLLLLPLAGCSNGASATPPTVKGTPTTPRQLVHTYPIPGMKTPVAGSTLPPYRSTRIPRHPLPTVPPVPTFTPIPASAYTATIYGTVADKKTGSPIPGAIVTVSNSRLSGKTSAFGAYRFRVPANVGVPITISATGYAGALAMGTLRRHQVLKVDFKLNRITPGKPVAPPPPISFGHS
ncbi:MAG TPA: carboxypeptidase regulatory-like domain-containing protein [Chloroflexota bacterium]